MRKRAEILQHVAEVTHGTVQLSFLASATLSATVEWRTNVSFMVFSLHLADLRRTYLQDSVSLRFELLILRRTFDFHSTLDKFTIALRPLMWTHAKRLPPRSAYVLEEAFSTN